MGESRRLPLLCLGAASAALQVLAIREGMAVTAGDETVVALLMGIWLIETALGAMGSRTRTARRTTVSAGFTIYGLTVAATLLAARACVGWIPLGQVPSSFSVALAAIFILAPACFLSGWLYGQLAKPLENTAKIENGGVVSAQAYWLDTLGSAIAGALLSTVILDHLLPFQVASLVSATAFLGAIFLADPHRRGWFVAALLPCAALAIAPVDRLTYRWHAPGQQVLQLASSPRGAVLVTQQTGQQQVMLQRQPILIPADIEGSEQIANISACLHTCPKRILLVGAPPGNLISSLLAHGIDHLTILAGDRVIADVISSWAPDASDGRVRIVPSDARAWSGIDEEPAFDLLVVNAGLPTSVAEARLYSTSFYRKLAKATASDGLLVVSLPGFAAYATEAERDLHSTVVSTLKEVFPHILALPGDRTLYVASSSRLIDPADVGKTVLLRMKQRGIDSRYLTEAWVNDRLSTERIHQAALWSGRSVRPSTDTHPVIVSAARQATFERLETGLDSLIFLVLSTILMMMAWVDPRSKPVSFAVASTGFSGLALQLTLMLVIQTAVGALYRDVALVTGLFMGASCAATVVGMRRAARFRALWLMDAWQLGVAMALAVGVDAMMQAGADLTRAGVIVAALLMGAATGGQFAVASRMDGVFPTGVGASVYGLDLAGAALAAFVSVTWLIPTLGISGTLWAVAGCKAVSLVALVTRSRVSAESLSFRMPLPMMLLGGVILLAIQSTHGPFQRFINSDGYRLVAILVLAAAMASAFEPMPWRRWIRQAEHRSRVFAERIGVSPLRLLSLLALLPVAAQPLGRCMFAIPYLFCHVCPRPCIFGVLRRFVIASALVTNLGDLRFCQRVCPLGLAQASVPSTSSLRKLGKASWWLRIPSLALVIWWVFGIDPGPVHEGEGIVQRLYQHADAVNPWVLWITGGLLLLSFFVRRPFCESICPIGSTSEILVRADRLVRRRRSPQPP